MAMKCCSNEDGPRWGWVIAFSGFWINLFMFGVFRSAGVLYVALMYTFHSSYAEAAWPGSLIGTAMALIGPVAGVLSHFFSTRVLVSFGVLLAGISVSLCYFATKISHIVILFGICLGIGTGLMANLIPVLINKYFVRQRATACGIFYIGSSVGAVIFPIIVNSMIEEYSLRGTFLLLGGLLFHCLWGSLLLRPVEWYKNPKSEYSKTEETPEKYHRSGTFTQSTSTADLITEMEDFTEEKVFSKPSKETSLTVDKSQTGSDNTSVSKTNIETCFETFKKNVRIFKNAHFMLTAFSYVSSHNVFVTIMIVLPDYAEDRGIPSEKAVFLLSIYALTDIIGRILPGMLANWKILNNNTIMLIALFVLSIFLFLPGFFKDFGGFLGLTLVYGLTGGIMMVMIPVLVTEYVGTEKSAIAYGFANFFNGLASLLRPIVIGYIKEKTGKYDYLFIVLGLLNLSSVFLWVILLITKKLLTCSWCGTKDNYYTTKT